MKKPYLNFDLRIVLAQFSQKPDNLKYDKLSSASFDKKLDIKIPVHIYTDRINEDSLIEDMSTDRIPTTACAHTLPTAGTVDDVRAKQVVQRHSQRVHQASERPDDEQHHGRNNMNLEGDRHIHHQHYLWVEVEDGTEPHRDGGAVVKLHLMPINQRQTAREVKSGNQKLRRYPPE